MGAAIEVLPSRAKELAELPPPHNIKTLEKAVGTFTYVAPNIPHFAERIAPLRQVLKKARSLDRRARRGGRRPSAVLFPLHSEALAAFWDLQKEMTSPRRLAPFREGVPPIVVSDACQFGVAATLYQEGRLVATWSAALSETQGRWKVFDLEAYALTRALQRWRHWLQGPRVVCVTDHKGLTALTNLNAPLTPKVRRWIAD